MSNLQDLGNTLAQYEPQARSERGQVRITSIKAMQTEVGTLIKGNYSGTK